MGGTCVLEQNVGASLQLAQSTGQVANLPPHCVASCPAWRMSVLLPPLDILYEDNHCLAIAKPSGTLSTHYQGREETLDRAVKQYLKEKYHKPGQVFLGVVQRLDRPVS